MVATMCRQSSKKANTFLAHVYREKNFNLTSAPGAGMAAATSSLTLTIQD